MARPKTVGPDDRLTLVEHLDELRHRLVVSAAVFGVALALCFWQNHLLLSIANAPLPAGREPVTFGITEPFTTTLTVVGWSALLISLPVILYQAYAFVVPAFAPRERQVIVPLLVLIPVLFVMGVVFAYFVVVPAAAKFLLDFNSGQFNIQVRAHDYYSFLSTTLLAVGLVFQVPVGILAVHPARRDHAGPALGEPPLCVRRVRGHRGGPAGSRPGDDADRDGPTGPALRGQRDPRPRLRDPGRHPAVKTRDPGEMNVNIKTVLALAVSAACLFLSACGGGGSGSSTAAQDPMAQTGAAPAGGDAVTIKDFAYAPPNLTVASGTRLTFTNNDSTSHTATSTDQGGFDTGTIEKGQTKSVTVEQPGTYSYICSFHPFMHGTVTVRP